MTDPSFTQHHVDRIAEAHSRLDGVDERVAKLEMAERVQTVRMEYIQNTLSAINANINKIVWLIIASIVGGAMTFIISGGLNGAQ
ncbi:hypothetical protein [Paenirhodobacter sp.]|uniref:hypothetical protein n=1 Tax=Paenirhodobacter sp. TaxID=1965326 RepID=UPI003B512AD0